MAGSFGHGNESSGSIKGKQFLNEPSDWYVLKDSVPCS
jgi:hypothetical protein